MSHLSITVYQELINQIRTVGDHHQWSLLVNQALSGAGC